MADDFRVMSRFVRPIYAAIDSRQYKAAIKLCQHKKVAHLDIVQVLRAHCLERLGRDDEALTICRRVQTHAPTDETLLNTMSLVFRLCGREHEMLATYEAAAQSTVVAPSEELLQSLFLAYAKQSAFLKQQQTALKMFKSFPRARSLCWAVLSMTLQVRHGGAPSKMLALADRMLLKNMRTEASTDGEALQLLVHILQTQARHQDALDVFDEFAPLMQAATAKETDSGDADAADHHHGIGQAKGASACGDASCGHAHGASNANSSRKGRAAEGEGADEEEIELGPMQAIDRLALEASLADAVSQWDRSARVYRALLEQYNADDWAYLQGYLSATFQRQPDADVHDVTAEAMAFLTALAAQVKNARLRGPYLAMVHVQYEALQRRHLQGHETGEEEADELVTQMLAYATRFDAKACCFSDLKQYLALFTSFVDENADDQEEKSKKIRMPVKASTRLVAAFQEMADSSRVTTATSGDAHDDAQRKQAQQLLHRRLLSVKALRFLGVYASQTTSELEALVRSLVHEYVANSWLTQGATGGQREVQATDDLLLLAVHTLLDLVQRHSTSSSSNSRPDRLELLLSAGALLEYGLAKSAYNFQMKLLLSRVYAYLGAGQAMLTRHNELDIKNVQLDSLSFLVLDKLLQLCLHGDARHLCERVRHLHKSTDHDTPEYVARAYRGGVYSKVLDMTNFLHDRMRNSHTLAIIRGECLQFELQEALDAGSTALLELAGSQQLEASISMLERMVNPETELSCNQHRDVVVQWTPQSAVRSADSFVNRDIADTNKAPWLVECDRSAHLASSRQWLRLQLVVPKMMRLMVLVPTSGSSSEELQALASEYNELVTVLQLTDHAETDVKARMWTWSRDVVVVLAEVAEATLLAGSGAGTGADSDLPALTARLTELLAPLTEISEQACAVLTAPALSAYALSTTALLFRDAGVWAAALSCTLVRAWAKKRSKKKDDGDAAACLAALRALLKGMQDMLLAVEAHVQALPLAKDAKKKAAPSSSSLSPLALVVDMDAIPLEADRQELLAAQTTMQQQVAESQEAVQRQLTEQLYTAAAAIRGMMLQK